MAVKRATILTLTVAGLVAVWAVRSDPGRITLARAYSRLEHVWTVRWPLDGSKNAVLRAAPLLNRIGVAPVRVRVEPGVSLLLDPRDLVQRTILRSNQWEPATWQSISASLGSGAVFLDIGAHIGYFSLKAAARVGRTGLIVAFEPNPATVKLLRDNVAASDAANLVVQPVACTDRERMLTLYDGPAQNTGTASLSRENAEYFAGKGASHPRQFSVRGRRIDDVVRELGLRRVDAMKVDVEGAEFEALSGALDTLKRFHPRLVVELIPRQLAGMGAAVGRIEALLEAAGYNHTRQLWKFEREWTVQ